MTNQSAAAPQVPPERTEPTAVDANLPDVLYHYCSSETFCQIVKSHTIRLSSMRLSNDSKEGRWLAENVLRLAKERKLEPDMLERLRRGLSIMEVRFDGLGFCLSEDGDLLSQWRGYGDDAKGVAIGFSREYLEALCRKQSAYPHLAFALHRVEYSKRGHESRAEALLAELTEILERIGDPGFGTDWAKALVMIDRKPFCLKSEAFREEREWRLLARVGESATLGVEFRGRGDRIVPYTEVEFPQRIDGMDAIKRVMLGPRHITPTVVVSTMLRKGGFSGYSTGLSQASYRP